MMMRSVKNILLTVLLLLCLSVVSCKTGDQRENVVEGEIVFWTPYEIEYATAGSDPLEGFNRTMFEVHDFMMEYVARPVGWVYCTIVPRPVTDAIYRAAKNLEYPSRLISCLGSARWTPAWDETARFFINSTVGIGGLFDPAERYWNFYSTDSDFGTMFASWGIGPGCTLVLPLCRPTNVRDVTGYIFDSALDPKTYLPYTSWVYVNTAMRSQPVYNSVVYGKVDRYSAYRAITSLDRELTVNMAVYNAKNLANERRKAKDVVSDEPIHNERAPIAKFDNFAGTWLELDEFYPVDPARDTLRALFFVPEKRNHFWYYPLSAFNSDFREQLSFRHLKQDISEEKAVYTYISSKDADDGLSKNIAILIPGIGSQCDNNLALAMGELLNNAGYGVVSTDNSFNWRFMVSSGNMMLPGYTPHDTENVENLIKDIISDLEKRTEADGETQYTIVGWSLGGLQTLHLADRQEKSDTPLRIVKYLAINPPVDMEYAMTALDNYRKAAKWNYDDMYSRFLKAGTVLSVMRDDTGNKDHEISNEKRNKILAKTFDSIEEDTAQYGIAMTLGIALREVLFAHHRKMPLKEIAASYSWGNRFELYKELDEITFKDYLENIIAPRFEKDMTKNEVVVNSGLKPIRQTLENNDKIRVIHTADDFLLNDNDRKFLSDTLKSRLVMTNAGGHFGELYHPQVREKIVELLTP